MRIRHILICMAALVLAACANNRKAEQFVALPFPDAQPPAMMDDTKDLIEYMALHWWDGITEPSRAYPCDSLLVSGVKISEIEQKFANWANVLNMVHIDYACKCVAHLYDRALACEKKDTSSNVFESFNSLVAKYLYDPNSPLRNEDHYAAYAAKLAKCEFVEPVMQGKYDFEVRMASLNRIGSKAADFRFTDMKGRSYTLYGIKSELVLLFFSNPGCGACKEIIDVLSNDPKISGLISEGVMKVLNIYIDEDLEAWRSYMPIYPDIWYNGFDPDFVIRGESLYNVRAIPSLYLLDSDKNVLMKDAPEAKVFDFLSRL